MKLKTFIVFAVALILAAWQLSYATMMVKACDLVNYEELEAFAGGKMWGRGELLQHGGGISECMFQYEENRIYVRYRTGISWFEYVKKMDKGEAISNIGDEAYWYSVSKSLIVRVKDNTLQIQMAFPPNGLKTNQKTAAINLAKKAITRLKP